MLKIFLLLNEREEKNARGCALQSSGLVRPPTVVGGGDGGGEGRSIWLIVVFCLVFHYV